MTAERKEELLKRKRVLEIEKSAIEKYMGPDEHDEALQEEWDEIINELKDIEEELKE